MSRKAKAEAPLPSGQRELAREFVRRLERLGSHRNPAENFRSFLTLSFNALAKLDPFASPEKREEREAAYMAEVKRMDADDVRKMPELLAIAFKGAATGDFLGVVAGELGSLNAYMGQFFTPFEVCRMMAKINMTGIGDVIRRDGYVTVHEPAAGAGAMLLACAEDIREQGFPPYESLLVQAVDLSEIAYRMCFIQLALSGIPAQVIHGNSLSLEVFDGAWTAATGAFYLKHRSLFGKKPRVTIRERRRPPLLLQAAE